MYLERGLATIVAAAALWVMAFAPPSNAESQNIKFTPASIMLTSGRVLASDYKFIWTLNHDNNLLTQINIVNDDDKNLFGSTIISPAGIASHENTVYVANYRYHEILIGHLSGDSLYIDRKFSYPDFISPEGIAASDKYIAVADYDANEVLVFDLEFRLLLKIPLPLAHGIAIKGDTVYASGFAGDSLVKIDVQTGQTTKSSAKLKYPTTVQISPDGDIVVLDANAGTLTYFDNELEIKSTLVFGNGRASSNLLRAYGFAFDGATMLFADTYNRRIARYADGHLSELASINHPVAIGAESVPPFASNGCFASTIEDSNDLARFLTETDGDVTPCVQGLQVNGKNGHQFVVLPFNGGVPQTFVWGIHWKQKDEYIFGDPTSQFLYVINTAANKCKFVPLPADLLLMDPRSEEAKFFVFAVVDQFPAKEATCKPLAQWAR
jgi:hypothetical protein